MCACLAFVCTITRRYVKGRKRKYNTMRPKRVPFLLLLLLFQVRLLSYYRCCLYFCSSCLKDTKYAIYKHARGNSEEYIHIYATQILLFRSLSGRLEESESEPKESRLYFRSERRTKNIRHVTHGDRGG